jgi:hypothetical protein
MSGACYAKLLINSLMNGIGLSLYREFLGNKKALLQGL